MAKMGTRKVIQKELADAISPLQLVPQPVNLVINPFQIQPVATLGLPLSDIGMPIMREGFITATGFLVRAGR
jgi:hypothetical protein